MRSFFSAMVATTLVFGATDADAASILVSGSPIASFEVNGGSTTIFENILSGGNTLNYVTDMSNAAQVNAADALFVVPRDENDTLSAAEIANITAFIGTGKRVYLGGENTVWEDWNNSILSLVGGSQGAYLTGTQTTILMNDLTAGVASVNVSASSGTAVGGTSLFNGNFANLWGASQNVLTVQDANMWLDAFKITAKDNQRFAQNIAAWLSEDIATPVPVPAAGWLMIAGFGGLAALRRRKKVA